MMPPLELLDDDALLDRAINTYWDWVNKWGGIPQSPSRQTSEVQRSDHWGRVIIIRNVNGELARYWAGDGNSKLVRMYEDAVGKLRSQKRPGVAP